MYFNEDSDLDTAACPSGRRRGGGLGPPKILAAGRSRVGGCSNVIVVGGGSIPARRPVRIILRTGILKALVVAVAGVEVRELVAEVDGINSVTNISL